MAAAEFAIWIENVRAGRLRFSAASTGSAMDGAVGADPDRAGGIRPLARKLLLDAGDGARQLLRRLMQGFALGVRRMPRPARAKSRRPAAASSARTWAESVGWLTASRRAAAVNPPASATAWNARAWVRLTVMPIYRAYLCHELKACICSMNADGVPLRASKAFAGDGHGGVAQSETGDPLLLTPGPLTTARSVKEVMVHDWGSRDAAFLRINGEVLDRLPDVINGRGAFVTVPMQGSGTFAVEAMLTTFVPRSGKCLLLINGAYGHRAKKILDIAGRATTVLETRRTRRPTSRSSTPRWPPTPPSPMSSPSTARRRADPQSVHGIAEIVARHGRRLLVDSMSAFGALPLDAARRRSTRWPPRRTSASRACRASASCWRARRRWPRRRATHTTLVLDLHDQHQNLAKTGQYRFTPPIHVIVSFHQALMEFFAEGGQPGRGARYAENGRVLAEGMAALGFRPLLPRRSRPRSSTPSICRRTRPSSSRPSTTC